MNDLPSSKDNNCLEGKVSPSISNSILAETYNMWTDVIHPLKKFSLPLIFSA